MKDLLISIDCDYSYHVMTRNRQTYYNYIEYNSKTQKIEVADKMDPKKKTKKKLNYLEKALTVDPNTCELVYDLEKWKHVRHFPKDYEIKEYDTFDGLVEYGFTHHKQEWDIKLFSLLLGEAV